MTAMSATLVACGGGGSGSGDTTFPPPPASDAAQVCAPTNPYRGDALEATKVGTLDNEKAWLHSYMSDAYLWYSDMPKVNAASAAFSNTSDVYGSLDNYFKAQKTPALTASGKPRDQFSFTIPTKEWNDLINSGSASGYGIEWYWDSPTPPRNLRIAYVEPGSPAANAGLLRGDHLLTADGVSGDTGTKAGVDTLNAALFPSADGQSHSFSFSRDGAGTIDKSVTSATVIKNPVPTTMVLDNAGAKVGYVVFTDHIASSEQKLIDAVNTLKAAAVTDLVLDLRYNGGGYLYLASELAYMIAGKTRTDGKVFEQLTYNSKRSAETNSDEAKTPFFDTSCILSGNQCTDQKALPTLNLSRVTVIATGSTCSASEAIINGLRGVDVEVRIIGSTSCGKPYGFTAKDNCGISYLPIEFKGVNAKGFGDYADGFAATCPVSDDFDKQLGDTSEGMLSAALYNLQHNACDLTAAQSARRSILGLGAHAQPRLVRGPERESRIVIPRR